jgi:DNA-binding CsgD family transcriptional regulator
MTTGFGVEADLPYAGLHALLRPVVDRLDRLPAPQRAAISGAFGLADGSAPDRFLIGLAALGLLTEMTAEAPVLVIVDDAQWLDPASADALVFLSRRLGVEPVAMVFAVREGVESPFDSIGLDELQLGPIAPEEAAALLDSVAPELDRNVRARVLDEAAGNPLALIELPNAIRADSGHSRLPAEPLPLSDRLQRAFRVRADELPAKSRTLLLVAAVSDRGATGEVVAAGRLIVGEASESDLTPAVEAGLLRLDGTSVEFRHPLVRSAIYEAATRDQRREASAALAETLVSDPDRAVWHWAAAADGPDETVVRMLEATAERARVKGASATAMAAFERAARLTSDEKLRGSYLIRAADAALTLGQSSVLLHLLREAEPLELEPTDRSWLLWHLEQFEPRWTGAARVPALAEMARDLGARGEVTRAAQMLSDVAFRCWWGNPATETRELVVEVATGVGLPSSSSSMQYILGLSDPVGQGARVVEQLSRSLSEPDREPWEAQELGVAGTAVWADDIAIHFLAAAASGERAQGKLGRLAGTLVAQAWAALQLGRWETASTSAAEAAVLARETSQLRWVLVARLAEAAVAASRGDIEVAESIIDECEQPLLAYGAYPLLALVQLVRGRSLCAAGRFDVAYGELQRIFDPSEPAYQPLASVWAVVDLAEAAANSGRVSEARLLLEPIDAFTASSSGALLLSSLRFARAVLAAPEEIEDQLAQAVASDFSTWPFTRARLLLAQGSWLRRQGQAAASRVPLRAATTGFHALGAAPWAERAAQELRASGEAPRPRRVDLRRELTAQELQIARMAADGLTNREIGQRLFLSHRTIATHLYNVYPKLGVSSRGQLRQALDASAEEA